MPHGPYPPLNIYSRQVLSSSNTATTVACEIGPPFATPYNTQPSFLAAGVAVADENFVGSDFDPRLHSDKHWFVESKPVNQDRDKFVALPLIDLSKSARLERFLFQPSTQVSTYTFQVPKLC
jgi:hypothetical protein